MERKLIDYLPHVIRDYAEYQGLTVGEQPEFELAWDRVDELLDNQFVLNAGSLGLSRWEEILGVVPKATDSLSDRRFRVLSRLNAELPYTLPQLRNILQALCDGHASANLGPGDYELTVKVGLSAKNKFHDTEMLLRRVCPQNLILTLLQMYNSHAALAKLTHAQCANRTHDELRNEVLEIG